VPGRPAAEPLTTPLTLVILNEMVNSPSAPALDRVFHALADPTRRAMVERLGRGPASVGQLAAPLAMSLPAVLQHLQVLEASGLVRSQKVGRVRTCQVVPAALRSAEQWIADRRSPAGVSPADNELGWRMSLAKLTALVETD
jgi:DNA-binding transcriptional ArsR family regulator